MAFEKSKHLPAGNRQCHLALIPDGARRWAIREGVPLRDSYIKSVDILGRIVPMFLDAGVEEISIFCSVVQNRDRPENEVQDFIAAGIALDRVLSNVASDRGYRYRFFGLTGEILSSIPKNEARSEAKAVNIVFDYDPFEEIRRALEQIDNNSKDRLEEFFQNLSLHRPIDFVIRTGGYKTLSNFFPMLIGYSRMEFLEKLFNDVTETELKGVFDSFFDLPRRYGI